MVNVLILEDDEICISRLKMSLIKVSSDIKILTASELKQAYYYAMNYDISLFVLDISLDKKRKQDVSGLEFARGVRQIRKYRFTDIIFTTALYDEKLYAYSRLHCYAYLEKPIDYDYFEELVEEIIIKLRMTGNTDKTVFLKKRGVLYPVLEKNIVYIGLSSNKTSFVTTDDIIEVSYMKINDLMKMISEDKFIRCSRFNIVNIEYIKYIDTVCRMITLKNELGQIEIGRAMKKDFMEQLMRLR